MEGSEVGGMEVRTISRKEGSWGEDELYNGNSRVKE